MANVRGVRAILRSEAVVVFGRDRLVRAARCPHVLAERVVDDTSHSARETAIPRGYEPVVVVVPMTRFHIHLGVAIAELTLYGASTGRRIHRDARDPVGNRALEQIPSPAAHITDSQRGLHRKRLLYRHGVGRNALRQTVVGRVDTWLIASRRTVRIPRLQELRPVDRKSDTPRRQRRDDEVIEDELRLIFTLPGPVVDAASTPDHGVAVQ